MNIESDLEIQNVMVINSKGQVIIDEQGIKQQFTRSISKITQLVFIISGLKLKMVGLTGRWLKLNRFELSLIG